MSIEEKVQKIVCEQLGVSAEEVKLEASFIDDLGADSLDTVELVMAFEEEFDIEIPDEEAEAIQTVLRREGYPKPYEALKELTRTNSVINKESIHQFIDGLNVDDNIKAELKAISPYNYIGVQLVK